MPVAVPHGPRDVGSEIVRRESVFRWSLVSADVSAASIALLACVTVGDDRLTPLALLALPLVVVVGKAQGLYDRDELLVNKTTLDQAPQLFQSATLYTLLVLLAQSVFFEGALRPREAVVLCAVLLLSAVLARRFARLVARKITTAERCLFVGSDESYERLQSKLPEGDCRAQLVGRMSLNSSEAAQLGDSGALTLRSLIENLRVHRVIIEPNEALPQITLDFVREAKATNVRVSLLPRILEVVGSAIEVDDVDGLTLLGVQRFGLSRSSRLLKRGFDVAVAGLSLIAMAPLLVVIAVLIRRDGPGPLIVRQGRIGRDGQPFDMWRFRTMLDDARLTSVGRWLRRTALDQLPQLVNVLRGEMSLVGPRPLLCDESGPALGPDRLRLQLTPGMTGHWQTGGPSRVPPSEMVKLDYLYVAGWSLWKDVKILLRTVAHLADPRGV